MIYFSQIRGDIRRCELPEELPSSILCIQKGLEPGNEAKYSSVLKIVEEIDAYAKDTGLNGGANYCSLMRRRPES